MAARMRGSSTPRAAICSFTIRSRAASLPALDMDAFTSRNLQKAGYEANPLEDASLEGWQVHAVPLTTMTVGAL